LATAATLAACALLAAACGGSSSPSASASSPAGGGTGTGGAGSSAPAAASGGTLPSSCDQLKSIVGSYIGGVGRTQALVQKTNHVSCEFFNSAATKGAILNVGASTPSALTELEAKTRGPGRTTAPVSGLGVKAFSTTNQGKPAGMAVLTSGNALFVVTANLSFAQDEAMLKQLMSQF
jgi:hypothetical protein